LRPCGLALIFLPLVICTGVSAQDAAPGQAARSADGNAAVTSRWPQEDTPQHTVGRAPTQPAAPSAPAVQAPLTQAPVTEAPPPRGWSSLMPKESAPATQARAQATPKAKVRHAHVARAKASRVQHAASRPRVHHAASPPRTSGRARPHGVAGTHRPL